MTPEAFDASLRVIRIVSREHFERYASALRSLLRACQGALLDDADWQAGIGVDDWLENLADSAPWLWLGVDAHGVVYTGASLTDIAPGRSATLHGISRPTVRRRAIIGETALAAMECAYFELDLPVVRAECRADNTGAKGFCWRCGFHGEGRAPNAVTVNGRAVDLLFYALSRGDYVTHTRRILTYGIRQEKKRA
ncbi:MAG: GNAT family N-acetyltransferase [Vampirovibrionales bacterium]|nr:GNAT family N-acetyltransferase [Vampirovibrionales bacterium]